MKFLCANCNRMLEVERFRLDGATLVVTCTQCGGENRAEPAAGAEAAGAPRVGAAPPALPPQAPASAVTPAPGLAAAGALRTPTVEAISRAAAAASQNPFEVPEGFCPKCLSKRTTTALACPSCGLTFTQAEPQAFAPGEWLQGQWRALLQAWGDDARHEALRAAAMNQGELAQLGRLYRLRLASVPDDPYALRGRDEVLRLAVLPQVTVQKLKVEGQPATWKYVALSTVIVGCLLALFFLLRQLLALT